jgi:cytochrome d ubiquinol oxidase subunit I
MAIIVAFLGSGSMFMSGDLQTREVAANQPVKFAAMEGVCQTGDQVPLDIIGIPPAQNCQGSNLVVAVPYGLSLMMSGNVNGAIKGLDQADPSLWPPIATTYLGFHAMVGLGALMVLLMLLGAFFLWRRSYESHRWWLWAAVLAMPLPIIAIELGWMVAEVGRQPWIVQGLMKTSQGVSPGVSAGDIWISLIGIVLLYLLLFGLWLYELRKEVLRGPAAAPDALIDASAAMQNEGGR